MLGLAFREGQLKVIKYLVTECSVSVNGEKSVYVSSAHTHIHTHTFMHAHTHTHTHTTHTHSSCRPRHWGHSMHGRVPPVSGTTTIL